eukprot:1187147-Prorocentrum_minimum.AAC.9
MGDPDAEYSPPITLIIVQKRHRARFFPQNGENDNSGNVLPGTVIDTDICDPHFHDFYMVRPSHIPPLGPLRFSAVQSCIVRSCRSPEQLTSGHDSNKAAALTSAW